jgi:hypothetical protein
MPGDLTYKKHLQWPQKKTKSTTQTSRKPILTTKDTKSTKKNHPYGLFQNFVSFAPFVVKKFSQK